MKKILIIMFVLILLVGLGGFLGYKYLAENKGVLAEQAISFAKNNIDIVTNDALLQEDAQTLLDMLAAIFVRNGKEYHYLVLLQNNMELRPGGGFLGQYATITVQDAHVTSWEIFDANHLDREIISDIEAPASFQKWLGIPKMEFRDSNWEVDFARNAQRANHLYNLSPRQQEFDGVFAVNVNVLRDLLEITGDITVPGYEKHGAFRAPDVLIQLQDIVEKPFILAQQREACKKRELRTGVEEVCNKDPETGEKIKKVTHADRENRKQILPVLMQTILVALIGDNQMTLSERVALGRANLPKLVALVLNNLGDRDIQMWFADTKLQSDVARENWGTVVDTQWVGDYVAVVDANLGALKTDYHIKRSLEYTVDFTGRSAEVNDISAGRMIRYKTADIAQKVLSGTYDSQRALATMRMSYEHTAPRANYRTSDYHAYTRLYTPAGTSWKTREWFGVPDIEDDVYGNKQAFGYKFDIFIGDTLPTMLQYTLPKQITQEGYALKIQKQPGVESIPAKILIITEDGEEHDIRFDLTRDVIVRLVGQGGTSRRELTVEHL